MNAVRTMHSEREIDVYSTGNIKFLLVDTATVAMPTFQEVLEQLAEIHDLEVARPWVSLDAPGHDLPHSSATCVCV